MEFKVNDLVEPSKRFLDSKHRPFGYFVAKVIDVHNDAKPPMVQMKNLFNGYEFWQTIEYIQHHTHASPCCCHHHCCCCAPVEEPINDNFLKADMISMLDAARSKAIEKVTNIFAEAMAYVDERSE